MVPEAKKTFLSMNKNKNHKKTIVKIIVITGPQREPVFHFVPSRSDRTPSTLLRAKVLEGDRLQYAVARAMAHQGVYVDPESVYGLATVTRSREQHRYMAVYLPEPPENLNALHLNQLSAYSFVPGGGGLLGVEFTIDPEELSQVRKADYCRIRQKWLRTLSEGERAAVEGERLPFADGGTEHGPSAYRLGDLMVTSVPEKDERPIFRCEKEVGRPRDVPPPSPRNPVKCGDGEKGEGPSRKPFVKVLAVVATEGGCKFLFPPLAPGDVPNALPRARVFRGETPMEAAARACSELCGISCKASEFALLDEWLPDGGEFHYAGHLFAERPVASRFLSVRRGVPYDPAMVDIGVHAMSESFSLDEIRVMRAFEGLGILPELAELHRNRHHIIVPRTAETGQTAA